MKQTLCLLLALTLLLAVLSGCAKTDRPAAGTTDASETTLPEPVTTVEPEPVTTVEPEPVTTVEPEPVMETGETSALGTAHGKIYLYGEYHSDPYCLERELAAWRELYEKGARHLLVEDPYYTAAYLNEWMQADSDDILLELYDDFGGSCGHSTLMLDFFRAIKVQCPETIFLGTDVGHQYDTTGARYIRKLTKENRKDSEEFRLASKCIEQGRRYYSMQGNEAEVYRENCMVENFIEAYERTPEGDVLGIYGGAHVGLNQLNYTRSCDCMGKQLYAIYGDAIEVNDLSIRDPIRTDQMEINGKEYEATYFGSLDLMDGKLYDFWRIEDAYADFADCPTTGLRWYFLDTPSRFVKGQVFVIDFTARGQTWRHYFRADGKFYDGDPVMQEFTLD